MDFRENNVGGQMNNPVKFIDFEFDPSVQIADSVYEGAVQQVTNKGCLHIVRNNR